MIEIDGSYGEGGGAVIRVALALSTLTQKPFHVHNIRAGRPQPGLKALHLTAINALRDLCNADITSVDIGMKEFTYIPGKLKSGNFSFDIGTAGSITLLLQALLLPLMFGHRKTVLTLTGGMCGKWQAPIEYFQHVLVPQLERFCTINCSLQKRGYYPAGGGKVTIEVIPKFQTTGVVSDLFEQLSIVRPYALSSAGTLVYIKGISHASANLQGKNVAERQAQAARAELIKYNVSVSVQSEYHETLSSGTGITLWARFNDKTDEFLSVIGADAIGEISTPAENVGRESAVQLKKEIDSEAVVDVHCADQLLPFLALLNGSVIKTSTITEHTRTNMWVIEKFLPVKFEVSGNVISVRSI